MKELKTFAGLENGDVLLAVWSMEDRLTGKPYVWRWFGVVMDAGAIYAKVWNISSDNEMMCALGRTTRKYWSLDTDEWPDGVHALRMKLILEGRIDV